MIATGSTAAREADDTGVFWREFATRSYAREPFESDKPSGGLVVSPDEMFRLLLRSCADRGSGPRDPQVRFHIGQHQVIADLDDYLPTATDDSLDGYLARLEAQLEGQPYLLAVQHMQAASRWIWKKVASFLAGLYEATGILPGNVDVEAFVGQYPNTVPGIHRERSGVFVSMVQGSKDMLVWPPDAEDLPIGTSRYEQARASARHMRCEPGRLVYWPAEHWHVGECPSEPTAGIHIAVLERPLRLEELVGDTLRGLGAELGDGGTLAWSATTAHDLELPKQYDTAAQTLVDAYGDPVAVREKLVADWLRRRTALGFTALPPRYPEFDLSENDFVERDGVHPIMLVSRDATTCLCAADGRLARMVSAPALTRLIERINSGEPVSVGATLRLSATIPERELLLQALSLLAAWRTVKVIKKSPSH